MRIFGYLILLIYVFACSTRAKHDEVQSRASIENYLSLLSRKHAEAEAKDSLATFIGHYEDHAISMPEYQLTLDGLTEIEAYYAEVFKRQNVKSFQPRTEEFIHLDSATVVEIGTFDKEFSTPGQNSSTTLRGKYWHVWQINKHGDAKIKGEAFGYFHPVEQPDDMIVETHKNKAARLVTDMQQEIPFELKAYNALMEKGVRTRDAALRASFFTDDGSFFPFADTTVTGMDQIKPYLIAYSSRGQVSIDSIHCYSYDFEQSDNYILEYDMFKVRWSTANGSGRTEGKGIRIWKRQPDHSLRLYREIGTHNHIK